MNEVDLAPASPRAGRRATPARIAVAVVVVLFVVGFTGWLVQGAGSDDPVPTVPFTIPAPDTAPPDTPPIVSVVPESAPNGSVPAGVSQTP